MNAALGCVLTETSSAVASVSIMLALVGSPVLKPVGARSLTARLRILAKSMFAFYGRTMRWFDLLSAELVEVPALARAQAAFWRSIHQLYEQALAGSEDDARTDPRCRTRAIRRTRVTAVDFAPSAIAKARANASDAGVDVDFVIDDTTTLATVSGTFDILVDYGTFDDLSTRQRCLRRSSHVAGKTWFEVLALVLEWEVKTWERLASAILPVTGIALQPGEGERWFTSAFDIKQVAGETGLKTWPRGWDAYLMTRR
jgi:SAM-dependent methyltransferase